MAENENKPRLIERGFCLKQASIESLQEKNVRHGHISTLHIWPARRPLAACRAALIATLLPDPGDPDKRKELLERIGGKVVRVQKRTKKDGKENTFFVEETEGGILHWGRESESDLNYFRKEIRKAYGGEVPKVLDPFAGGGAIPLEAMRLGCEATSIDINPVAWFIEKCTLEYPQQLAGQKLPLPNFILENKEFMDDFYKMQGIKPSAKNKKQKSLASFDELALESNILAEMPIADLSWHVRSWGWWVLEQAKNDLTPYYPSVAGKPTVAYLWAKTVTCKNCRSTIPLLKTRWLCKNERKRVLLMMRTNDDRSSLVFEIQSNVAQEGLSKSERIENDKRLGQGTMSRNGAWCPHCGKPGTVAMSMEDIRREGVEGRIGAMMTAVVIDGEKGKEYRLPVAEDLKAAEDAGARVEEIFNNIPFGVPDEPTPIGGNGASRAFSVDKYGINKWSMVFTKRQLFGHGIFVLKIRSLMEILKENGYPDEWRKAIISYLVCVFDKLLDHSSTICSWNVPNEQIRNVFSRFALPVSWDFAEVSIIADGCGSFFSMLDSMIAANRMMSNLVVSGLEKPIIINSSAISNKLKGPYDLITTDPPYYDAIPYSDTMDFFYVWLRRILYDLDDEHNAVFKMPLAIKWDSKKQDGELIDDSGRFAGNSALSKQAYENGMAQTFQKCYNLLNQNGILTIVFAHKKPDAWETLVSSIIRAGFVVESSWPIQTERATRSRALSSAALSSSIWLVCKKRPLAARQGWDAQVLEEMRSNIQLRLREYWDSGIRGPDFIWAATGPALEAYSKHSVVKKADNPGQIMTVSEFLVEVRRIVMDFVVGRVLGEDGERDRDLDNITTYYLLHRHDFGFGDAPAGSCILYAVSCDLSDSALVGEYDVLLRSGGIEEPDEGEGDVLEEDVFEEGTSSALRLKQWNKRVGKTLGLDNNGRPAPMIDRMHKLMHLWKDGDMAKVDEYLDGNGLLKNKTFHHILQAIIELSKEGDEERSLLESISNHIISRGGAVSAPRDLSNFGG